MTEVTCKRIESFVTNVAHDPETGEPYVLLAMGQHDHHYVFSFEVAQEMIVGFKKAMGQSTHFGSDDE